MWVEDQKPAIATNSQLIWSFWVVFALSTFFKNLFVTAMQETLIYEFLSKDVELKVLLVGIFIFFYRAWFILGRGRLSLFGIPYIIELTFQNPWQDSSSTGHFVSGQFVPDSLSRTLRLPDTSSPIVFLSYELNSTA